MTYIYAWAGTDKHYFTSDMKLNKINDNKYKGQNLNYNFIIIKLNPIMYKITCNNKADFNLLIPNQTAYND